VAQSTEPPEALTGAAEVVSRAEVQAPRALSTPLPDVLAPPESRVVVLELLVNADGTVRSAERVSGSEPFVTQVLQASRDWRFVPATRGGQPIAARIRFEVRLASLVSHTDEELAPVAGVKQRPVMEVTVKGDSRSGSTIDAASIRQLPGAFGDPFRALEAMPGVVPVVSGAPYFFVRGAPPGNVGYYIDGIQVPLLYHLFFGPGVLDPSLVDQVTLHRGAYPARLGRFAGGVVEADLAPPPDKLSAEGRVRLYDAGGRVSVPFAGGKGNLRAGGRYSYAGALVSLLSNVEIGYWDYHLIGDYELTARDHVGVFSFGSYDYLYTDQLEPDDRKSGTEFHRVDLRWDHSVAATTHSRLALTLGQDDTIGARGGVNKRMVALRSEVRHSLSPELDVLTGGDIELDHYNLELATNSVYYQEFMELLRPRDDLEWGGYIGTEWRPTSRVLLATGVRGDLYRSDGVGALAVEPRVSAEIRLTPTLTAVHALGLAHQPPGFVPGVPGAQMAGLRGGLQRALQASSGVRWRPASLWTTSVTGYESVVFNATDSLGTAREFNLDFDVIDRRSTAASYGLEFEVKRRFVGGWGGWLAYTLSRSTRTWGPISSMAAFDRTHVFQAAANRDLGKHWTGGARLVAQSGVPTRYLEAAGPRFAAPYADPFFRLDLRFERRWELDDGAWWALVLEWLNATLQAETVTRSCADTCVSGRLGPVTIPSVGVEAGF